MDLTRDFHHKILTRTLSQLQLNEKSKIDSKRTPHPSSPRKSRMKSWLMEPNCSVTCPCLGASDSHKRRTATSPKSSRRPMKPIGTFDPLYRPEALKRKLPRAECCQRWWPRCLGPAMILPRRRSSRRTLTGRTLHSVDLNWTHYN